MSHTPEHLTLMMEGPKSQDGGKVPVTVFLSVIQALHGLMGKVAKRQIGKKGGGMKFLITGLSMASPVRVEITPYGGGDDAAKRVIDGAGEIFGLVSKGQASDIFAPEFDSIEKIITPYDKGLLRVTRIHHVNGAAAPSPLVDVNKKYVSDFMRGREYLRGVATVAGDVKALNLKSSPIKLRIYPKVGNSVVWCLPSDAEKTALKAIGKRVAVTGDACYRPDNSGIQRPYCIDTTPDNVKIFGSAGEGWRKYQALHGAFPKLTGGKDAAGYLRELDKGKG